MTHLYSTNKVETSKQDYPLFEFIPGILNLLFLSVNQKIKEMSAVALLSICSIWELEGILNWIIFKFNSKQQLGNKHIQPVLILVYFLNL